MNFPKCPQCGSHRILAPARCFVEIGFGPHGEVGAFRSDEMQDLELARGEVISGGLKCGSCSARFAVSEVKHG